MVWVSGLLQQEQQRNGIPSPRRVGESGEGKSCAFRQTKRAEIFQADCGL
jgi:hypothetical protein